MTDPEQTISGIDAVRKQERQERDEQIMDEIDQTERLAESLADRDGEPEPQG